MDFQPRHNFRIKRTTRVSASIKQDVHDTLKVMAAEQSRSLSSLISHLLSQAAIAYRSQN